MSPVVQKGLFRLPPEHTTLRGQSGRAGYSMASRFRLHLTQARLKVALEHSRSTARHVLTSQWHGTFSS